MNKILLALVFIIAPFVLFSQAATLVINGTTPVNIVEHGGTMATPIYININNPATTAIKVVGTEGYVVSENEWDVIKWNIGTGIGNYVVPFGYTNATPAYYYLPLTLNIATAGAPATGSILFSTWHTVADQAIGVSSLTGDPSDVNNMGSFWGLFGSPSDADNSYNAVDRFWIIDTYHTGFAYTTKPTLGASSSVKFSYISSGGTPPEVGGSNIFVENTLLAQRFHVGTGWGDWLGGGGTDVPGGTIGTANTGVAAVTPANFFRSWTLSSAIDPLPITISSFSAQCVNDKAVIEWTSQTELNNDYYSVERTTDGVHFETVGTVKAQGTGTSNFPEYYTFTDLSPLPGTSYYYLFQTDIDGDPKQAYSPVLFDGCGTSGVTTVNGYNTTNFIEIDINAASADNFNISLVNMLGQSLLNENHAVAMGSNEIRVSNNVSPGIYILNVRNDKINYAKKLVLGVK